MKREKLFKHVFNTYLSLRFGMAVTAFALPWVVAAWGYFLFGIALQPSISDYYWAAPNNPIDLPWSIFDQEAPSRVWFVGLIFTLAAFLYLYKGFSVAENVALNIAAALAVGVAIFPKCELGVASCGAFSLHGLCAVGAFACLAYVVWFCSKDTLPYLPLNAKPKADHYRSIYNWLGVAMAASPIAAFILNAVVGRRTYIFFIEFAALTTFAAYWWIKSTELRKSEATRRALAMEISTPSEAHVPASVARLFGQKDGTQLNADDVVTTPHEG